MDGQPHAEAGAFDGVGMWRGEQLGQPPRHASCRTHDHVRRLALDQAGGGLALAQVERDETNVGVAALRQRAEPGEVAASGAALGVTAGDDYATDAVISGELLQQDTAQAAETDKQDYGFHRALRTVATGDGHVQHTPYQQACAASLFARKSCAMLV